MKKIVLALAVSTALATPAMAQDSTANVGSFWVSGLAGIDSVRGEADGEGGSEEGVVFGISAGYDVDSATAFGGVEVEATESTVSVGEEDIFDDGDEFSISVARDLYVGLRAGARVGNGKVYVKGGYTNLQLNANYDDGSTDETVGDDMDGYRVGVGGEFGLGTNLAVRIEYRYSDYGELEFEDEATGASFSRHQGIVGLVAKF